MIFYRKYIVDDILKLSKEPQYQDVTIICHKGSFQSNSFLMASLFPIFRDILKTSDQFDESCVTFMPDMDKNCLENFYTNLYPKRSVQVPDSIMEYLPQSFVNLKEELKEDEPDYSLLDVKSDDENIEVEDNLDEYIDDNEDDGLVTLKIRREDTQQPKQKDLSDEFKYQNVQYDPVTKKFNCPDCDYSTKRGSNMNRHYKYKHLFEDCWIKKFS